jgi:hypothetical protein
MTLSRRQFVSGSILLGAGLVAGPALSNTLSRSRADQLHSLDSPLLIRTGLPLDQELAGGAAAAMRGLGGTAPRELQLPVRLEGGLHALTARLEPYRNQRLMGIMADSSFLLLQEAVRDMYGAVLWHGAHTAGRHIPAASLGQELAYVAAGRDNACEALARQCASLPPASDPGASFVSFVIEI